VTRSPELFSITRSTVYRTIARDRVRMAPLTLGREAAMPAPAQGAGQDAPYGAAERLDREKPALGASAQPS
jgi:hypothetical protein